MPVVVHPHRPFHGGEMFGSIKTITENTRLTSPQIRMWRQRGFLRKNTVEDYTPDHPSLATPEQVARDERGAMYLAKDLAKIALMEELIDFVSVESAAAAAEAAAPHIIALMLANEPNTIFVRGRAGEEIDDLMRWIWDSPDVQREALWHSHLSKCELPKDPAKFLVWFPDNKNKDWELSFEPEQPEWHGTGLYCYLETLARRLALWGPSLSFCSEYAYATGVDPTAYEAYLIGSKKEYGKVLCPAPEKKEFDAHRM
jgi:hypothetical protein